MVIHHPDMGIRKKRPAARFGRIIAEGGSKADCRYGAGAQDDLDELPSADGGVRSISHRAITFLVDAV
jgi:hypothetical protein